MRAGPGPRTNSISFPNVFTLVAPITLQAMSGAHRQAVVASRFLSRRAWFSRSRRLASRAVAMAASGPAASSHGRPPPPPPPAVSQGAKSKAAEKRGDDADHFFPIKVATYNVGASQAESFQSGPKIAGFKQKLRASRRVILAIGPHTNHQKCPDAGSVRRGAGAGVRVKNQRLARHCKSGSGAALEVVGGYLASDRQPHPSRMIALAWRGASTSSASRS